MAPVCGTFVAQYASGSPRLFRYSVGRARTGRGGRDRIGGLVKTTTSTPKLGSCWISPD